MNDEFYLRFEDKFRGPRDVIKKRQAVYLPIVEPLKALYPESFALDLGCGRGEWLELLKESGWRARGVDSNTAMFAYCKSLDLEVEKDDVVQYVRKLPKESVAVITGFHIAEHLKFDDLFKLIQASFQALIPGGVLILETPNPENIIVGACNFYIDPTHRNQLPPIFMEFLAADTGFYKYRTLRLNASQCNGNDTSFKGALSQLLLAHPDYALVAQKMPAEKDAGLFALLEVLERQNTSETRSLQQRMEELDLQLKQERQRIELALQSKEQEVLDVRNEGALLRQELFAAQQKVEALSHQTGVLETELAAQHGQTAQREQDLAVAREYVGTLETKAQLLKDELDIAKAKNEALNHSSPHWFTVSEGLKRELQAVYASKSWRSTWPLRKSDQMIKWIAFLPVSLMRRVQRLLESLLKLVVVRATAAAIRRPSWEALAINMLNRYPKLKMRLKNLAMANSVASIDSPSQSASPISELMGDSHSHLSLRAQNIYNELKRVMEARKK